MRLSAINTIFSCKNVLAAKNSKAATVGVERRPAILLLERGSSIAKFLRAPTLKNICEGLLLKISISVASLQAVVQRCFCKKGVPRNFAKFTGKQLCQSLFFIKKETLAQLFSCEFFEISKNTFLQNTSEQLLLTCMNVTVNANKHFNINTKNIYKFA